MSYFTNFPKIRYRFNLDDTTSNLVTNIGIRSNIADFVKNNASTYVNYRIEDGERPDTLAHKVYGKSDYHWIILLFNDVLNPYFDWPLSNFQLEEHTSKTYDGITLFIDNDSDYVFESSGKKAILNDILLEEGTEITQGSASATVKEWRPNICRLHLTDVSGTFVANSYIFFTVGEKSYKIIPRRIVLESRYALHHFEDSSGNYLDPNEQTLTKSLNDTVNLTIKQKESRNSYLQTDGAVSRIRSYLAGNDDNVVTNFDFEISENEAKRNIKLLKSSYLNTVVNNFVESLNTPIR